MRSGRRLGVPYTEEPGCELYVAIHDAPDGTIVMIEKWTSARELDDHGGGDAVRALNSSLEGLLASPVEVTRLVPLPAGARSRAGSDPPTTQVSACASALDLDGPPLMYHTFRHNPRAGRSRPPPSTIKFGGVSASSDRSIAQSIKVARISRI